ncbi:hypothetical protein CPC08DRAFT_631721 [Agrocybe pediades]|nr:hypothetical protein CPC08DRAFT_631721 [Agrocybe pediades]
MLSFTIILLCTAPILSYAVNPDWSAWERSKWRRSSSSSSSTRNVPPEGYYSPLAAGGSMLTLAQNTWPVGQGEPLNAIISGNSDERVLQDKEEDGGLRNYFLSFGFAGECLGQHVGDHQAADLGDGRGFHNETAVIRWNYGDPQLGTCKETIQGGNHFRYWVQDGPSANSGAIFMATSYEKSLDEQHGIVQNGYNLGRDWLVGNITGNFIDTPNVTDSTTFTGTTSWSNYTYQTDIKYVSGLLQNTNIGINHNDSVSVNGMNASDGLVAVLLVKITETPQQAS